MPLFCYYFVTRIHWSNKTNRYICIGNKIRTLATSANDEHKNNLFIFYNIKLNTF